MDVDKWSPIFSKTTPRQLTLYYHPENLIVIVPDYGHIKIVVIDSDQVFSIPINVILTKLSTSPHRFKIKFDEQTKLFKNEVQYDNESLIKLLLSINSIICDHYGAQWFKGEPMIMDSKTFLEWRQKNFHHGVEPETVQ